MILTRTKTEAMKMVARATWETGLEGKGFTSVSEPEEEVSVCQPGKVARRMKVRKARTMATILERDGKHEKGSDCGTGEYSHQIGKDDAIFERRRNPYQIQWILVYSDQICKG
jgi:hypothetical protein